ncbi:lipid-binding SYLF domain-containing protein [Henriciella aquimarina]|uniref:lipid-binding SYLF domain-containing protein n=1 Tax=Henriciella aquimarina TaxID=545261 RepID=UPI000A03FF39|nr:YSC84-related protein [Henriciella aquimarina]
MTLSKSLIRQTTVAAAATAALSFAGLSANAEGKDMQEDATPLKHEAMQTLQQCRQIAESCSKHVDDAAGVLVFPEVWKADLIVGGAGGDGVLFVDDKIEGYYDIGKASVGLQAGIDESAMVYIFRDEESLDELRNGQKWEAGAAAGVTLVDENADAMASTGDPLVYVLEADGLNAELNVSALRIWEDTDDAS